MAKMSPKITTKRKNLLEFLKRKESLSKFFIRTVFPADKKTGVIHLKVVS